MKILVTGATGYIGGYLTAELAREVEGASVVGYGGVSASPGMDISDASSVEKVLKAEQPDIVINCAAIASPAVCERDAARAASVNCPEHLPRLLGTEVLLVQLSTDQVYDGEEVRAPCPPVPPSRLPRPLNVYARSKAAFEKVLEMQAGKGPRVVVLRCSNVFGPPVCGKGKFLQWVQGELAGGRALSLYSDEKRSFVFLGDVLNAVAGLCRNNHLRTAPFEVFNLGGPHGLSRASFGLAVARALNISEDLVRSTPRGALSVPAPLDITMEPSDPIFRGLPSCRTLEEALPLCLHSAH